MIIGISGKKQSGKTTIANYACNVLQGEGIGCYVFSFADALKKFCITHLGLKHEQVYGSDEQKNSIVPHMFWENMPGVITPEKLKYVLNYHGVSKYCDFIYREIGLVVHESGPMTAREVMQFVGTDVGRKMYEDMWVCGNITSIREHMMDGSAHYAEFDSVYFVPDTRFPNEVKGIQKENGYVCRLSRTLFPNDTHKSEIILDNYNGFNFVLDNRRLTEKEQGEMFVKWIKSLRKH